MIQRIQTVYLLIVAGLFFSLMFLPLSLIESGGIVYSFDITGLNTMSQPSELVSPTWSLMVLSIIITLISLISIFQYKKRILQMRMCVFNSLLIIGFCAAFGFYMWQFGKSPHLPDINISLRLWAAFPIVSLILNYLAIRSIGIDEALVRSLDRLR